MHIHEEDSEGILTLCDDACEYLCSILLKEPSGRVQIQACERAIASLVIYDYAHTQVAGAGISGKIPSIEQAKALKDEAFSRLSGLIRDDGAFCFMEVCG